MAINGMLVSYFSYDKGKCNFVSQDFSVLLTYLTYKNYRQFYLNQLCQSAMLPSLLLQNFLLSAKDRMQHSYIYPN